MKALFNINSPFIRALLLLGDLLILNTLAIICSIPVITIGVSQVSIYDALIRRQNEEGHIIKNFFSAFKSNFVQTTIIWVSFCVFGVILCCSLSLSLQMVHTVAPIMSVVLCLLVVLCLMALSWVFPLQAKFSNTVTNTLKNAFICAATNGFRSLAVAMINIVPVIFFIVSPMMFLKLGFLWVFLWCSLAAYCNLKILNKPIGELVERSVQESKTVANETSF